MTPKPNQDNLILGIDLGGTNTKMGIVNSSGILVHSKSILTTSTEGALNWVKRVHETFLEWNVSIQAIGVGSPGPLDTATGTLIKTPNLRSFENFPLKVHLETTFGVRAFFENDANCAALAEHRFGRNRGTRDMVVLTLGTGIGSGVIVNGSLLRGHGGYACELGHMIIDKNLFFKNDFSNLPAMAGTLEGLTGAQASLSEYERIYKDNCHDLKHLFERSLKNDSDAKSHVDAWTKNLAVGLYNIVFLFNPKVIVLTGGVSAVWPLIRPLLDHFLNAWVPTPLLESLKIETSEIGPYFGVVGAASLVLGED